VAQPQVKPAPPIEAAPKPPLAKPRVAKSKAKPKPPSESRSTPAAPAPVNVQAVGLLGSLKKSHSANTGVVTVDSLSLQNNAVSTSDDNEKILVKQASGILSSGKITRDPKPNDGRDVLAEASSDVPTDDGFKASKVTAVGTRFAGDAFSIDANEAEADGDGESSAQSGLGASVHGGLSRGAVGSVVYSHRQKIRQCYQAALVINPKLTGRLVLKWKISAAGAMNSLQIVSSDLNLSSFESCVTDVLRAAKFPANPKREPTRVIYPFVFKKS
jgi:hypothetical protein